jgi:hypothetical protein
MECLFAHVLVQRSFCANYALQVPLRFARYDTSTRTRQGNSCTRVIVGIAKRSGTQKTRAYESLYMPQRFIDERIAIKVLEEDISRRWKRLKILSMACASCRPSFKFITKNAHPITLHVLTVPSNCECQKSLTLYLGVVVGEKRRHHDSVLVGSLTTSMDINVVHCNGHSPHCGKGRGRTS